MRSPPRPARPGRGRCHAPAPCAARGRRGSAARSTGRPCARRRPSGTESTAGAKLRMLVTPAATSRSQTPWAAAAGVAMTPMATRSPATISSSSSKAHDRHVAHLLRPPVGVAVEQRHDAEAAGAEPGVVGQRVPEVADADDDDGEVLGDADLAGDLVAEVLHVVADPAGAVGAQVGQVLAQLGAVDAGGGGELLAGAGARCRGRRGRSARAGRPAAAPPSPRGCRACRAVADRPVADGARGRRPPPGVAAVARGAHGPPARIGAQPRTGLTVGSLAAWVGRAQAARDGDAGSTGSL